ncbi:MAG TPA: AI-2E family transporter [Rhodanobacteraceae bacterium]|jgi:predicted PurR-regulated permease PerM|nr:AI-2E family transporter [Rhodanobacteraceae bacterium]
MLSQGTFERALSRELLDVLIRTGLIAALVIFCYRIFSPFLQLMLWSMILTITLYPLQVQLKGKLGNKDGRAATLIVLIAIGIILVPIYLLGTSMTHSVQAMLASVKSGEFHIPPPAESVASWPLIGQRVYDFWLQATADLTGLAQRFSPRLSEVSLALLGKLAGLGLGLMMFVVALVIAGIVMANGENGERSALRITSRIFGPDRALQTMRLCTATIRAVAQGVVGIAFIQMLLIGVGFVLMGIPGAGLLALAVLLLGIMQLPTSLITLPVIVFVFLTHGANLGTIVFAIYVFIAGLSDNVLKPLLLGRGVDVPMPVVLIGALGGMVTGGITGLFIGPVILAVGYQLFWQWVEDQPRASETHVQEQT